MSGPDFRVGAAAALGLALHTTCALAAAAPDPAAGPLSFLGAYVGMPQHAWATLPPPGRRAAEAQCAPPTGSGPRERTGGPSSDAAVAPVTCAYVRRFGRFSLPVTVRLSNGLLATHLRYTFQDGRLQRITYQISVDAYDRLIADLHARLGAADSVRRDSIRTAHGVLPRVSQTWRTPMGAVQIVDPVPPYAQLQVSLSARDRAAQPSQTSLRQN
jgi:hypothetical protein